MAFILVGHRMILEQARSI